MSILTFFASITLAVRELLTNSVPPLGGVLGASRNAPLLFYFRANPGSVAKVWTPHLDTLLYKGYLNSSNKSETLPL